MTRDRYPGYDVLSKRWSQSWNAQTRRVIDDRLALPREPRFLTADELATLSAIAARITPQPADRPPIPVAAMIDHQLMRDQGDGYRNARMLPLREAWRCGLNALNQEASTTFEKPFRELTPETQDELLKRASEGSLDDPAWEGMPSKLFFKDRLLRDIVRAYYAHPTAWSEIGFGGPAGPRGYVRMGYNRRDPWEPAESHGDDNDSVRRENRNVG